VYFYESPILLILNILDVDELYQLDLHRVELCRLCVQWETKVRLIPCAWTMPDSWGPSSITLGNTALAMHQPHSGEHMLVILASLHAHHILM
jgi:hypothetical protein